MPKRKGRGRPKRSSVRKKVKESADNTLDILDNPLNADNVESDHEEVQEADVGMPKKRGRGRPKGSRVQNCQESVHGNLNSNMVEVGPECKDSEGEDVGMPKKRGRGRPNGSRVQNCQENVHSNLNSHTIPSDIVGVGPGCEESEEADTVMSKQTVQGWPRGSRGQNCQESADGNLDICINPSNMMEVNSGCEEKQEAGNTPKKSERGRPKGSTAQKKRKHETSVNLNRRGRRGLKRELMLELKRQQSADGKLDVIIHPTRLVAVGPGRNDFIADLSIIVRKHARLNVHRWRQISKATRDTIVQSVLNNWRLPDTDMVRKAILDEAGRLYRNWRNRLHDYYLMFETKEEALKHVPDDINVSDWPIMVDYFSSPSFELISTINKVNRAKMRTNHTAGRKAYQAVSYDARELVTGKEPDLQTLWHLTHKRANGEWVDEASKEIHDKVAEQIDEKLRDLDDSQEGMETIEPEIINNAFKTVVGKKSYMQGPGAGLRSSSSIAVQQLQAELEAQKREAENARKECNEIKAKLVEVECQLNEERLKREDTEARLLDRQKDMQEINSQVQTAIQTALLQYNPATPQEEVSSKQKTLIAELEAQLNEAEDVISDLRSELGKRGRRY